MDRTVALPTGDVESSASESIYQGDDEALIDTGIQTHKDITAVLRNTGDDKGSTNDLDLLAQPCHSGKDATLSHSSGRGSVASSSSSSRTIEKIDALIDLVGNTIPESSSAEGSQLSHCSSRFFSTPASSTIQKIDALLFALEPQQGQSMPLYNQ